ncbi:hypothetical protein C8J56DRAFT_1168284 [Mycena floridula]|nr:hypothetical protein C8J56DRAFT_1168284 [Mycena floridula]
MAQASQIFHALGNVGTSVHYDPPQSIDRLASSRFASGSETSISTGGSFQVTFDGIFALIIGDAFSSQFSVSLDSVKPFQATSMSDFQHTYAQWYQSPTVSEGIHSLNITNLGSNNMAVNYIAAAAGRNTALMNRTLLIDETYPSIHYGDGWNFDTNSAFFQISSGVSAMAFQNTTHQTSSPGANFTFSYTGGNIKVVGFFLWNQLGSFDLIATVDNQLPVSQTFDARADQNPENFIHQPNFLLFSSEGLQADNHTITLSLARCDNQTLIIDHILYVSAFNSLATMPDVTTLDTHPPMSSSPSNITLLPTIISASSAVKKVSASSLAGGIIGGIIFLLLVLFLFLWKSRARKHQQADVSPATAMNEYSGSKRYIERTHSFSGSSITSYDQHGEIMWEIRAMREEIRN